MYQTGHTKLIDRWALAAFLTDYHSGQWSRGYRILCRMRVNLTPNALAELRETDCYAYLVARYRYKV